MTRAQYIVIAALRSAVAKAERDNPDAVIKILNNALRHSQLLPPQTRRSPKTSPPGLSAR